MTQAQTAESTAPEGITPAFVIETNGTVPCADGLVTKTAEPVPAAGDLFGTQFSQSVFWGYEPTNVPPWDFQFRVALVDIDGDVGPFSDWVYISGDVGVVTTITAMPDLSLMPAWWQTQPPSQKTKKNATRYPKSSVADRGCMQPVLQWSLYGAA